MSKWEGGEAYGRKGLVKQMDGRVAAMSTVVAVAATVFKAVQFA